MHQHHTGVPRCEHLWSQPHTPEFQVKRKICAEDHCRVVEGDEECHDKVVETAIEVLRRHVKHIVRDLERNLDPNEKLKQSARYQKRRAVWLLKRSART